MVENTPLTVVQTTLDAHTLHMSENRSLSIAFMLLRTALLRVQAVASACQHFVPHNLNIAPDVILMTMNKSVLLPFLLNLEDCLVPSLLFYTNSLNPVHLQVLRLCQTEEYPTAADVYSWQQHIQQTLETLLSRKRQRLADLSRHNEMVTSTIARTIDTCRLLDQDATNFKFLFQSSLSLFSALHVLQQSNDGFLA